MLENYQGMLTACGIATKKLTPAEVYLLATRVMQDGAVHLHCSKNNIPTADFVSRMSVSERHSLRDRVLGVAQLPANRRVEVQ